CFHDICLISYIRLLPESGPTRKISPTHHSSTRYQGLAIMLDSYRKEAAAREAMGIPALPLTAQQTAELIELLKNPPKGEESFLLDLFTHRVPAGVDEAASVKASYLAAVALGSEVCPLIDP